MFSSILMIGIGGFTGAIARYLVFLTSDSFYHKYNIPFGTMIVNLAGSLMIGMALGLSIKFNIFQRHSTTHYIFITGFLGAFTTFSTFSSDNFMLLMDRNYPVFAANILVNTFLGIALTAFGFFFVIKIFQ